MRELLRTAVLGTILLLSITGIGLYLAPHPAIVAQPPEVEEVAAKPKPKCACACDCCSACRTKGKGIKCGCAKESGECDCCKACPGYVKKGQAKGFFEAAHDVKKYPYVWVRASAIYSIQPADNGTEVRYASGMLWTRTPFDVVKQGVVGAPLAEFLEFEDTPESERKRAKTE